MAPYRAILRTGATVPPRPRSTLFGGIGTATGRGISPEETVNSPRQTPRPSANPLWACQALARSRPTVFPWLGSPLLLLASPSSANCSMFTCRSFTRCKSPSPIKAHTTPRADYSQLPFIRRRGPEESSEGWGLLNRQRFVHTVHACRQWLPDNTFS